MLKSGICLAGKTMLGPEAALCLMNLMQSCNKTHQRAMP